MNILVLLLLLAGAVCFLVTAFGGTLRQINLLALDLLFWILVPLIAAIRAL